MHELVLAYTQHQREKKKDLQILNAIFSLSFLVVSLNELFILKQNQSISLQWGLQQKLKRTKTEIVSK